MAESVPFVIAVASEKGGVGKTTLATNLAVYLKALREDLPVTIVSFDNHFSVDHMFAIGAHGGRSVAELFAGVPAGQLTQLGEYGVQFLASERALEPPDGDPLHLRQALGRSGLTGILVIDTRPILDYFTRNALLAADLVLVPVKDRASLVNAGSLFKVLTESGGDGACMWLVPSLIDARLRLRDNIGIREFLVFSARERGYQVVETFIAKSPKVEGLATNLSSRVYPVLTHARTTAVHQQFRKLTEFVLTRFDLAPAPLGPAATGCGAIPPGRLRRLMTECPVCGERAGEQQNLFFQDLRSRRKGFLHPGCLQELLLESELGEVLPVGGLLVFDLTEVGFSAPEIELSLRLFDEQGVETLAERLCLNDGDPLHLFLEVACGRGGAEFFREVVMVDLAAPGADSCLSDAGSRRFRSLFRQILRELFTTA